MTRALPATVSRVMMWTSVRRCRTPEVDAVPGKQTAPTQKAASRASVNQDWPMTRTNVSVSGSYRNRDTVNYSVTSQYVCVWNIAFLRFKVDFN